MQKKESKPNMSNSSCGRMNGSQSLGLAVRQMLPPGLGQHAARYPRVRLILKKATTTVRLVTVGASAHPPLRAGAPCLHRSCGNGQRHRLRLASSVETVNTTESTETSTCMYNLYRVCLQVVCLQVRRTKRSVAVVVMAASSTSNSSSVGRSRSSSGDSSSSTSSSTSSSNTSTSDVTPTEG